MNTSRLLIILMFFSAPVLASESCSWDYSGQLYAGFSKGKFDVEKKNIQDNLNVTHNNASRVDANIFMDCDGTLVKYMYSSGWDLDDKKLETSKLINAVFFSNEKFGSLIIGQFSTPYKISGKSLDPFWDTASGTTRAGNNFGFSKLTRGFTPDSMVYRSPGFNDIYLTAGYSGSNSNGDYHGGFEYRTKDSSIGVQYLDIGENPVIANGSSVEDAIRIYGQNTLANWRLSASLEALDTPSTNREKYFNLSAQRQLAGFGRIAFSYGQVEDANIRLINGSPYQGDGYGVSGGAFYDMSKILEVYIIGSHLNLDQSITQNSLAIGFKYNLKI